MKPLETPKKPRLEQEELEVYGSGHKTSVQLTSYIFEVCDNILNIGPISHMAVGERANEEEVPEAVEPETKSSNIDLEIVTSSGHGKNGALCVLQNSIKPQIITSFSLSDCIDVWTVIDESVKKVEKVEDVNHAFMILSQPHATMVLQTGDEINEIENTGFCTNQRTIFVGNLGNNRFIVQVTTKSIRLLQGTRLLQNIPIDLGCPLTLVSIADPYVCVRADNGQVITLALREAKGAPRLAVNKNTISSSPAVMGMSAYRDVSGMFTTKYEDITDLTKGYSNSSNSFGYMKPEPDMKIEDEEDLLYGESGFKMISMADMTLPSTTKNSDWWRRYLVPIKPTFWLLVTRDNGNLEIYSMPDLKLVYLITNVGNGNKVLSDSKEFVPLPLAGSGHTGVDNLSSFTSNHYVNLTANIIPREILMVALGGHGTRPLLFIRLDNDVLIYRAFKYPKGHLKVRFRRIKTDILYPQTFNSNHHDGENVNQFEQDEDEHELKRKSICNIRYFANISGYNGVVICGYKSYFVFLTTRGELRTHRLYGDIQMKSFAAFNNVNCPNGFLYFDESFVLKIAVLPKYLAYDTNCWPLRKVPLRCSPTHLVYHKEVKVYCLVMDTQDISNKYFRFNGEDKELTEENKGERFLYPQLSKFSVILVSPTTWEIIPSTSIDLEEWEHVISFKNVSLSYEGARSGLKEYICVGTNYNYSEDITSRGRILIYDIIEVVPEPGKPLTKFKFKEIYIKEQKGPVSAITHVSGFLVTSVGQKV